MSSVFQRSPLLSDEELEELTGVTQPAAQRRWLDSYGVRYALRRDGRPRTTWGLVEDGLYGEARADGPDLSWMNNHEG